MQDITWDSQFEVRRSEGLLTTSDLLWFALQMARAMEHLTQLSVVHRDVALRNVLLKSDYTLKVADFGLSRLASDDGYYCQLRNVAMPIRYTSPEAMRVCRFSEHSECWAYGVALWELFTFSKKQPYAEECSEGYHAIMAFLTAGNRLSVPSTAPKPIRSMIQKLWHENPAKRPSFSDCQLDISKELNLSCPQILVRMQLDYDMLSIKRTSLDDVKIVQSLHNYLQKKKRTPAKNIYYKIIPEHQSRTAHVACFAALVAFVILALVLAGIAALRLNCGSQDMEKRTACSPNVTWSTNKGQILINGEQLVLKGVNYNGFETNEFTPYGLSSQSLDIMLDFMDGNDFNAVRLSFSIEMIQKNPEINVDCKKNEELCHLKALELMEIVIDRCAERGILVVLVCTQLAASSDYDKRNGLWYDDEIPTYTEENVLEAWDVLMNQVKKKWNLFALDVLDQPHHGASWGGNNAKTDFSRYAERFVQHILSKHAEYTGFFFIEGVHITYRDTEEDKNAPEAFQGENLMGVRTNPISTGNPEHDKRIIYSPHSFGPDLWNQTYFKESNFPKNMPSIWEEFYGFLTSAKDNPVIVGSWGGRYQNGTIDEKWQNAFSSWLHDKCLTNQFYWCLNGPSGTPFGDPLLSNSAVPNRRKLDLLDKLQPHPTRLACFASTSKLRIASGSFPNKACNK
uniref:Protein kinase domain-containing protein n=1 Tax=Plectus sambesii TaxID=2011161 RepID=A0A914ULZ7_9BILA